MSREIKVLVCQNFVQQIYKISQHQTMKFYSSWSESLEYFEYRRYWRNLSLALPSTSHCIFRYLCLRVGKCQSLYWLRQLPLKFWKLFHRLHWVSDYSLLRRRWLAPTFDLRLESKIKLDYSAEWFSRLSFSLYLATLSRFKSFKTIYIKVSKE